METPTSDRPAHHGRIILGMFLMAAGLLMLIERLGVADVRVTSHMWPLFPLTLGLFRLIDPPLVHYGRQRSRRSGVWLTCIGGWGLVNEFHLQGFDYQNSWPLVIVVAGIMMVWNAADHATSPQIERQR
jgi:hypothetical protein